ncbi:MAG: hypothetical protein K8R56_01685 [Candidatus Eisenbacteria bacterium]|nr:hypothetical protein [Candidatus Eisenbacteria bacterium]
MFHRSLLASLALLLVAATALAAPTGLNLAWNTCRGDGGTTLRSFACNASSGQERLVASVIRPAGARTFPQGTGNAIEQVFEIRTQEGVALPVWWQLRGGAGCRDGAIDAGNTLSPDRVVCTGMASAPVFIRYTFASPSPDRAILVLSTPVPTTTAPLVADAEYAVSEIGISHIKSAGAVTCAGCSTPVVITFQEARFFNNLFFEILTLPSTERTVIWQGSLPVATRNVTWSAIKTLYR